MRIRRVEAHAVQYTNATGPLVLSGGRVSTVQESTVVRIETDDGLAGFGESCVIGPGYAQGHAPATRAALELLARTLLGLDPRQPELVHWRLDAVVKGYTEAKSALDMACWDLAGRAADLRVADLLGGVHQESFPVYEVIGLAEPDAMAERCAAAAAAGSRSVQLKVGSTVQEDVARVEACMAAAGGVERTIVDANAYWPLADAIRVAAAIERHDVYLEQPCATLEECAQVRRTIRRPLVLDESLASVVDLLRAHQLHAMDAVRLKLIRFGGPTPVRRARDLAVALGLPVTIEDAGGGDVVSAALAQLACSIPPKLLLGGHLPHELNVERIARGTPSTVDGLARLPAGPGLGIDVDLDALGAPILQVE